MATKVPTVDEWRAELSRLTKDDPGQTAEELARASGINPRTMRHILHNGVLEGRYIAGVAYRTSPSGRRARVAVYRLAKGRGK